jgi:6-pyruvoyltetrahydropterin/6-carboxytetrahydropterin synthase
MSKISAVRYHDICMGHRVVGHEGKCKHLHGHNYRFHFHCTGVNLDEIGRVIDFSVIKSTLCEWLENNWDHRMLVWEDDITLEDLIKIDNSVVVFPYNPTAENIGKYIIEVVAPEVLPCNILLTKVVVEETRKCSVEVEV